MSLSLSLCQIPVQRPQRSAHVKAFSHAGITILKQEIASTSSMVAAKETTTTSSRSLIA